MGKMLHQTSEITEKVKKLIAEGVEITHDSQEEDVRFLPVNDLRTDFYIWEIRERYSIWKLECKSVLQKAGYSDTVFEESDGISLQVGMIAQRPVDPMSVQGQNVLSTIRRETSRRLDFLRQFIKVIPNNEGVNVYVAENGRYFINDHEVNAKNKSAVYYLLFDILYNLYLLLGEEISYKEYLKQIRIKIPKTNGMSDDRIRTMISNNLISEKTGFFRRVGIENKTPSGRKLIEVGSPGKSIRFNNKK